MTSSTGGRERSFCFIPSREKKRGLLEETGGLSLLLTDEEVKEAAEAVFEGKLLRKEAVLFNNRAETDESGVETDESDIEDIEKALV